MFHWKSNEKILYIYFFLRLNNLLRSFKYFKIVLEKIVSLTWFIYVIVICLQLIKKHRGSIDRDTSA